MKALMQKIPTPIFSGDTGDPPSYKSPDVPYLKILRWVARPSCRGEFICGLASLQLAIHV